MNNSYHNWDDVVFADRHKDYGAYVLRRNYPVYLTVSSLIVIVLFLAFFLVPGLMKGKQSWVKGPDVKNTDYIELKSVPTINKIRALKPDVAKKGTPKVVKEQLGTGDEKSSEVTFKQEAKPEFPGGLEALYEWLAEHLVYPPIAKRMGLEGKVVVEFTVDKDGRISNIEIRESSDKIFDDEALRAVMTMPDWTPGFVDSVKTTQTYLLPIDFVLS
jgi:periplasmic protein TonB